MSSHALHANGYFATKVKVKNSKHNSEALEWFAAGPGISVFGWRAVCRLLWLAAVFFSPAARTLVRISLRTHSQILVEAAFEELCRLPGRVVATRPFLAALDLLEPWRRTAMLRVWVHTRPTDPVILQGLLTWFVHGRIPDSSEKNSDSHWAQCLLAVLVFKGTDDELLLDALPELLRKCAQMHGRMSGDLNACSPGSIFAEKLFFRLAISRTMSPARVIEALVECNQEFSGRSRDKLAQILEDAMDSLTKSGLGNCLSSGLRAELELAILCEENSAMRSVLDDLLSLIG